MSIAPGMGGLGMSYVGPFHPGIAGALLSAVSGAMGGLVPAFAQMAPLAAALPALQFHESVGPKDWSPRGAAGIVRQVRR